MTIQNDFLPFAASENANVLSQADYQKLVARRVGFESGVAIAKQLNKVWRQSSLMAAALAQWIVEQSGQPMIDDGTTETIVRCLHAAIQQVEVAWSKIVDKPTTLAGYGITDAVAAAEKGQAGGVATLNESGQVPQAQLPAQEGIEDGAVTTPKLAPQAVTGPKLAPQAVTGDKLAPGAAVTNIGYTPANLAKTWTIDNFDPNRKANAGWNCSHQPPVYEFGQIQPPGGADQTFNMPNPYVWIGWRVIRAAGWIWPHGIILRNQ